MSLVWKHEEIIPRAEKPFEHDALRREPYADNLTRLIQSTTAPLVLSVNAQWGAGKTTFLRMWRAKLEGLGCHTLFFDAWKNDFVEDPLVALIAELEFEIKASTALSEKREQTEPLMKRLKSAGAGMLKRGIPVLIRAGTGGLVEVTEFSPLIDELGKGFSEEAAKVASERIERYVAEKHALERFRDSLEQLAATLATDPAKQPVVVFVDELDRCRPDFSILILERVKHLFSVPGFVFVLGMDASQLAASVRAVYGADFAAEGYLRRFIDIEFNLPAPSGETAVEYLAKQVNLMEALSGYDDAWHEQRLMISTLAALVEQVDVPFRTQQQCFSRLNLALRTAPKNTHLYPTFLALMIFLKAVSPRIYYAYAQGRAGAREVLDYLESFGSGSAFAEQLDPRIKVYLYTFSQIDGEYANFVAELRSATSAHAAQGPNDWNASGPARLLRVLEYFDPQSRGSIRGFFQRVELTDNFSG